MESISQLNQLKNSIDSISLNLYIIESNLNLIEMLNPIPNNIQKIITDEDLLSKVSLILMFLN